MERIEIKTKFINDYNSDPNKKNFKIENYFNTIG